MSDNKRNVPESRKSTSEPVVSDVKAFLAEDDRTSDDVLAADAGLGEMDELMSRSRSTATVVLFLIGLTIIVLIAGFVIFNEKAQEKFVGFVKGDLYEVQKQKTESMQKQYNDRMEQLNERYGDIKLNYFPRDSKVYIIQQTVRYDGVADKSGEKWGEPIHIDNATLHLSPGDELPELSIESLPVREKGMMCPSDRVFYPASRGYCPEWEAKCRAQEQISAECTANALRMVQYCPKDDTYYESTTTGVMICPDGETPMDPARIPLFVFQYSFLFEREDYVSQVVSYTENDWRDLGFGKFIIQFPDHFALIPDWPPLKRRYEAARREMRCWRTEWEDQWEELKRKKTLKVYAAREKELQEEKETIRRTYRSIQAPYVKDIAAIDVVRKVMNMATIRDSMAEIFYYCGESGKCEPARMVELRTQVLGSQKADLSDLGDVERGVYYGVFKAMGVKGTGGVDAFLASQPVMNAGLTCLEKWIPGQKEGQFTPVKDVTCEQLLEGIKGTAPHAAQVFRGMFLEQGVGATRLAEYQSDVENYLKTEADYQGTQKYADFVASMEKTGRFLEYLILAYLFNPEEMNKALIRFAQTRQINYRMDCAARQIVPSDFSLGVKKAMEMAWWTGSKLAFEEWYYRLWRDDVQGCLLFAREMDPALYARGVAQFQAMLGTETEGLRQQVELFREYRRSLLRFEKLLPELRQARSLFRDNRAEFNSRYPEGLVKVWEEADPDRYLGFLFIINEKRANELIAEKLKIEKDEFASVQPKEGDQPDYHKAMAYYYVFSPARYEAGVKVLYDRVLPMLMTGNEYRLARKERVDMPPLRRALQTLVNEDIHLKYFWLVSLTDQPRFVRDFNRLDLREARLVSKWVDPVRYARLLDLAWLQETPVALYDRYEQSVPALQESLEVDLGLHEIQVLKLRQWAHAKAQVLRKYQMRRTGESFKGEPTSVMRALERSLKMGNRVALLAQNLEDYNEAEVGTIVGYAMEQLRDEIDAVQQDSYSRHVDNHNDRIRMNAGFKKREWESLTEKFEKTAANAEWYVWLSGTLANKRQDCRKINYPKPDDWADFLATESN